MIDLVAWEEKKYRRELTAPAAGESTDEYFADSFPSKFSRFRASLVHQCYYFLASLHSNNFGICLYLQVCYSLFPPAAITCFLTLLLANSMSTALLH